VAPQRDDARNDDGPLLRALAALTAPLRALLGGADAVLGVVARTLRPRGDAGPDGVAPPVLRAIQGGVSLRTRRRSDAYPVEARPHEVAPCDTDVTLDIGDDDPCDDVLLALPRDPRTVFVTWCRSAGADAERAARITESPHSIRDALSIEALDEDGTEGADTAAECWVVTLAPRATSTYVDLLRPRREVRITLGTTSEDGDFVALIGPRTVEPPPAGAGRVEPPRWRCVTGSGVDAPPVPREPTRTDTETLHARAIAQDDAGAATPAADRFGSTAR